MAYQFDVFKIGIVHGKAVNDRSQGDTFSDVGKEYVPAIVQDVQLVTDRRPIAVR
jgi:hypothetical protein